MARVLIAGCGYVGSALAERLIEADHKVWGLRRVAGPEVRPGTELPGGVELLTADLCEPNSLNNLPSELDFVFYTAAAETQDEAAYRAAYLDGLGNILAALKSQGQKLKRFFLASSTAVYPQDAGEWVDEDSPTEDSPAGGSPSYGFRGRIMREAEEIALGSGFPAVIVRFGGIYGPGRVRFMERAPRGEMSEGAADVRYSNRIHRDDCAGVFHHLMNLTQVKSIYCVADLEPAPRGEVARWLYERHVALKGSPEPSQPAPGRPEPGRPEPGRGPAIARQAGALGIIRQEGASGDDRDILPAGSLRSEQAPAGPAPAEMNGKRCSSERLRATGYRYRYPTYREGYGALLANEEI